MMGLDHWLKENKLSDLGKMSENKKHGGVTYYIDVGDGTNERPDLKVNNQNKTQMPKWERKLRVKR